MKKIFNKHFEWLALSIGLILIASMNPYIDQGSSFCLLDIAGIPFCPGEGLGHSVAYLVRGDLSNALQANVFGPFAAFVILFRIGYLIKTKIINKKTLGESYG
ncbi:MAG: DUF2752 domain-containing protein [Balneolaceae bacterium]|nr:DUF2752 domain-containing protein [Balneolaceae bacterium]